jgi:TatD DNase family protein
MLTDSHAHLDAAAFDPDREAVLERAHRHGVRQILVPATDQGSWPGIRGLCADHAGVFPAYGWHPLFLADNAPVDVDALSSWLLAGDAVAVGEIGLDHYAASCSKARQKTWFEAQLQVARDTHLPVVVHALHAVEEVSLVLRAFPGVRGVVHSFSGSQQQAERLWDMGFLLGIGGPVTYPRARRLRQIVAQMPIDYLLLESDAPDQPDVDHRGQRNEPARVAGIARCIAELRGEAVEELGAATTANARRLFGLPADAAAGVERGFPSAQIV